MPQQFIKVKENSAGPLRTAFASTVKTPDWDSSSNLSNSVGDICRICHCEADTDNPLLSPCFCSGSLKYVHQTCLRQWLAASDTRSCELCKFNFILHTKIKPFSEWRILEMSNVERRRLLCAIMFHFVAAVCVIWSLFVLIDRAAEEVRKGLIAWPFWTKLVVVSVGSTGGVVFMYIQCRQYLHLFSRWKAHNRIILVQNAPEKLPPSPSPYFERNTRHPVPTQIVTIAEYNQPSSVNNSNSRNDMQMCYVFENECKVKCCSSSSSSVQKADVHVEDLCETPKNESLDAPTLRDLSSRSNILALDIECPDSRKKYSLQNSLKTDVVRNRSCVFKSLPNLSTSSENLLL